MGISVEVNVGGRVCDPGKQRKQSAARVANPQQDAGWLQTSLNVGEVSVEVSVGVSVEVIVGSSWKSAQVGVGRVCVWSLAGLAVACKYATN